MSDIKSSRLQEFRAGKEFCDIILTNNGGEFHLHKVILASASEYFRKLFNCDMKEKNQDVIEIKDVTLFAFNLCINFIYDLKIDFNVCEEKADEVFYAICLFQLWSCKKAMVDYFLLEHIRYMMSLNDCIQFYKLAIKYDIKNLEIAYKQKILTGSKYYLKDDSGILQIDFDTLKMILSSEDAGVNSEDIVYEGLEKWTLLNEEERRKYFCELFPLVRLPIVSSDCIIKEVIENNHIQNCATCKPYLQKALHYLIDKKVDGGFTLVQRNKRFATKQRIKINCSNLIINHDCKSFKLISKYTCTTVVLTNPDKAIPIDTSCKATACLKNTIYVMDQNNGTRTFSCRYNNNESGEWIELPSLPSKHNDSYVCTAVVGYYHYILVIGGEINNTSLKTIDCFDTINKVWCKQIPDIECGRRNCATSVRGDLLYVIGGFSEETLSSVEMYTTDSNKWAIKPNLNHARQNACAVSALAKIYVMGGRFEGDFLS